MTQATPLRPRAGRRRFAPLTGLFIALVVPSLFLSSGAASLPQGADATADILLNEALIWTMTVAVLAIVLFWERRGLSSIGLVRPTWGAFAAGATVMVLLLFLALGAAAVIKALGIPVDNDTQGQIMVDLPIWLQVFLVVSAGITEEILFRGYPIERLTELTGNRWVGALLPVIVFGAVHTPFWGIPHAIVAGVQGLLLTFVYIWRRNLWTNITAHALLDGFVFLLVDVVTKHGATEI